MLVLSILKKVFFVVFFYVVIVLYDSLQKNRLTWLVTSCLSQTPEQIVDRILDLKRNANIDIEIQKGDYEVFTGIVSVYQSQLSDDFWHGRISYKSKSCHFTSDMYFLFWFEIYLAEHYCDQTFNNSEMRYEISRKEQVLDGDLVTDTVNGFTDYGFAFMKLFYISCFLAESDKKVLSLLTSAFSLQVKSLLEEGQIKLVSGIRY